MPFAREPIDDEETPGMFSPPLHMLACPACRGSLTRQGPDESLLRCTDCALDYPAIPVPDLRLRAPIRIDQSTSIPTVSASPPAAPAPIPMHPDGRRIDVGAYPGKLDYGNGLTTELLSWLPPGPGILLDLGCGNRRCELALGETGLDYIGMDLDGAPDILGQAERLPFADDSFDVVFALGCLAHTTRPFVATLEVARVLKPGGWFLSTTQFLEPCVMESRHHVSSLGVRDWLSNAGLDVVHLEANKDWTGASALAEMGYLPGLPMWVTSRVGRAMDRLHARQAAKHPRKTSPEPGAGPVEKFTGGFRWIARLPG